MHWFNVDMLCLCICYFVIMKWFWYAIIIRWYNALMWCWLIYCVNTCWYNMLVICWYTMTLWYGHILMIWCWYILFKCDVNVLRRCIADTCCWNEAGILYCYEANILCSDAASLTLACCNVAWLVLKVAVCRQTPLTAVKWSRLITGTWSMSKSSSTTGCAVSPVGPSSPLSID